MCIGYRLHIAEEVSHLSLLQMGGGCQVWLHDADLEYVVALAPVEGHQVAGLGHGEGPRHDLHQAADAPVDHEPGVEQEGFQLLGAGGSLGGSQGGQRGRQPVYDGVEYLIHVLALLG